MNPFLRTVLASTSALLLSFGIAFTYAQYQPTQWQVSVTQTIFMPPAKVFEFLNTPKTWSTWSAWSARTDPTATFSFSGPEKGPGATYRWRGENLGNGSLTIQTSQPPNSITYNAAFDHAKYLGQGSIALRPVGGQTMVIWEDTGDIGEDWLGRLLISKIQEQVELQIKDALRHLNQEVQSTGNNNHELPNTPTPVQDTLNP